CIGYICNVRGRWIEDEGVEDGGYWGSDLGEGVGLGDGGERLLREVDGILVEVGPGNTLRGFIREGSKEHHQ
ncbi:hypothetical protein, partial [Bacillus pumilus]|uniref:hypothetical protein n=1 Tax=Bacillus pumilus TaxID=1408 RepID=UPI001C92C502